MLAIENFLKMRHEIYNHPYFQMAIYLFVLNFFFRWDSME